MGRPDAYIGIARRRAPGRPVNSNRSATRASGTLLAMEHPDVGAKLRAAFELSPTILAVSSLEDGRFVDVNDAFLRITGYTREEVIGRPISELELWIDPRQREEGLAVLRARGSIRDLEARFRSKRGEEIVTILNADLVEIEGRACVVNALIDITSRVRAEAALRESERRFAQAFNANPLPMSITSLADGRHLDVNDAALRHSGYTREEMLGRTKAELGFWVAPEQRERLLGRLRSEGSVRDFEVIFRAKSGDERHLLVNSEVVTYGGEPAVLSVSLDITERKQAEALREARRREAETLARAKDEFLAMLGHELRNPLATVTNALAVLNRLVTDAAVRRLTGIIGRQTAHLTRLVDDLLDVARVTSGKIELRPRPLELGELAHRCVEALAQAGRTAAHHVVVAGARVTVDGDPARLEQVITNLLDNALKYTPPGGEVRLTTEHVDGEAILRVRDTGRGIPAELLARVFDLFVQEPQALDRARGGLGLGLTLVKRLVQLHGGSVSVASAGRGLGSEFTVRLPAASELAAQGERISAPATVAIRPRRVLIVEDAADARESLRLLLELGGHEVETAEDARRGLEKIETFRPDVALVDIGLPGLDGYEMARMVRQHPHGSTLRLIAVTGYGQAEDQHRTLAAGFDVHVTKPVDPVRLEALLG
jgi:PAS domain S-box-containing protein